MKTLGTHGPFRVPGDSGARLSDRAYGRGRCVDNTPFSQGSTGGSRASVLMPEFTAPLPDRACGRYGAEGRTAAAQAGNGAIPRAALQVAPALAKRCSGRRYTHLPPTYVARTARSSPSVVWMASASSRSRAWLMRYAMSGVDLRSRTTRSASI